MEEAKQSQHEMAQRLVLDAPLPEKIDSIAGMDVSHLPFDPEKKIFAANVLFSYPDLSLIETATSAEIQDFPYIPGFLGFREAPSLVHAFECLTQRLDVILVDGHGFSHPRQLGIASQIGVLLNIPTIGIAKSILIGSPQGTLGNEKGCRVPLMWKGQRVATMLRTKRRCSPLIISAGHKINLEAAEKLVMACLAGYKLPEPTRHAHLAANARRLQN